MRVWYDACTGKHVRYGVAVAKRLRSLGCEVVLTTRKHPDTLPLAEMLGETFITVGRYSPVSLSARLKESLRRQLRFFRMFEREPPDYAVSHGSVELCRVAFGLGVPIVSTADSPHATAANRLALPLVDFLVVSKAFPKRLYEKYCVKRIFWFEGVDEVAWIKGFKPKPPEYESPFIVVRQIETRASYLKGKRDVTEELARRLVRFGKVIFLPRYDKRKRKGLIVPRKFVDSASLVAHASLVVSGGGTMAREAALQGTPSIVVPVVGRSYVNDYLSKRGFPLFTVKSESEVLKYAENYMDVKEDVKESLAKLENPVDTIEKLIKTSDVS